MTAWTTTQVLVDGVALAVHRAGRGPPLVCFSAIAHDTHDFDALAERVGDRFTVICVEWPSHGSSGDDHQPASARRFAALAIAALDQLGLPPPVVLGDSIGGAAAVLYASQRPVRGVVLCDSGGLVPITRLVRGICGVFEAFFAAGERGAAWFPAAFGLYYRLLLTGPAARTQRARIVANGPRLARQQREAWASFSRPDSCVIGEAVALEAPIWVAWAKNDWVIPLSFCRPAIARLRHATLSLFGGGHAPFLEEPDAFAEGFAAFAARLPPATARAVG